MCGIVASFGKPAPPDIQKAMEKLRHRGPDDSGVFITPTAALGHLRLSIIDVEGGKQPIFNETNDKCIILNGEIYNFPRLRSLLESRHTFKTNTDTEVILHLYEELGESCVSGLEGMFAFAIYDNGRLFLARDRIGIKPLYYAHTNGGMIFASEIKALTGYDDIREFPPGHTFSPEKGFKSFYELPKPRPTDSAPADTLAECRDMLKAAVKKRLLADVPVGVFLSGGLDSSIIAALMREEHDNLHSFAVGMENSPDILAARQVAQYLGMIHSEYSYSRDEMLAVLPEVIYYLESFDAPLVRSAVPCFLVSRLARSKVKVILTGEGADELFGGYHYLKSITDPEAMLRELMAITNRLHNSNLQRTDRMTMVHAIEGRVPFLDPDVIEFAFNLPLEWRQASDGMEKWFLRKAFESYLPADIVWRPKQKFSEGAGSMHLLDHLAELTISDAEFAKESAAAPLPVRTKEELLYYRIYCGHFGEPHNLNLLGRTDDY